MPNWWRSLPSLRRAEPWPPVSTRTLLGPWITLPVTELIDVTLVVTDALDNCRIPYSTGGSLASSFSGEPRASVDADLLVEMRAEQIEPLLASLRDEFYADADSLRRAIASATNWEWGIGSWELGVERTRL